MTLGEGEAVVEMWVWGRSPARFGRASTGVWCPSALAGSRGSQAALPAPIIFSPQREAAVFSSEEEGQPSSLTSPARVPAASPSWLGGESGKSYSREKPSKREPLDNQQVKSSLFLWLVVYIAPVYSQLLP